MPLCPRLLSSRTSKRDYAHVLKYVIGIVPGAALSAVTDALGRADIYRLTVSEVEVVDFDPGVADPALRDAAGSSPGRGILSSEPSNAAIPKPGESQFEPATRRVGPSDLEHRSDDRHRLRLEIAVNDEFLQPAIDAFRTAEAATSDLGFGPFWVSVLPLENTIRIRTGETGSGAI